MRAPGRPRVLALLAALALVGLPLAGCSSSGDGDGQPVAVELTPEGCSPAAIEVEAGRVTFTVRNTGADAVTEFEVLEGSSIVGEVEHVIEGLTNSFTVELEPGEYVTYCPGGTTSERGTLTVTAPAS
jgi:iron uptake system component EfeO